MRRRARANPQLFLAQHDALLERREHAPAGLASALDARVEPSPDEHIGADPDSMLWGTAGTLQHWNAILARVTDAYHQRGEFAPE